MTTPEYPANVSWISEDAVCAAGTFFMLGETPIVVPSWHQDHVVSEVLSLDLGLLKHDDVRLEDVEHALECSLVSPWLIAKRISNAVDIPRGDSDAHFWL